MHSLARPPRNPARSPLPVSDEFNHNQKSAYIEVAQTCVVAVAPLAAHFAAADFPIVVDFYKSPLVAMVQKQFLLSHWKNGRVLNLHKLTVTVKSTAVMTLGVGCRT